MADSDKTVLPFTTAEHRTPTTLRLAAEHLVKVYKGRRVVRDVSVDIKQGEIVGLLGPNGAGKTTTFYMIVGLVRPDAGQVLLGSEDITQLPMYLRAKRGISYLPQEASVFRKLTVEVLNTADAVSIVAGGAGAADAGAAGRVRNHAHRAEPRVFAVGRGETARGNRPRTGDQPGIYLARRAVCGHRSDRGFRDPEDRLSTSQPWDRNPHHRSQRAGNFEDH